MIIGGGLAGFLALALFVYCLIDVIATDEALMRNLPKMWWLLIVIFLPFYLGPAAWLLMGRPERAGFKPGDTNYRGSRPLGPDDSPQFLAGLGPDKERLSKWEEDLARREEELRRREQGDA